MPARALTCSTFLFLFAFFLSWGASLGAQQRILSPVEREKGIQVEESIQELRRQKEAEKLRKAEDNRRDFKPSPHSEGKKKKDLKRSRLYRKGRQCVYFSKVSILGDPFLSKADHNELTQEMTGRCLGPEEIDFLIRKTTNYYIERGLVTTRVYIPTQNLNDGSFELRVVPGYIESIEFKDKNGWKSQIFTAFPTLVGQRLNLWHIEQGLEQINRLPSNNARMGLAPGKKPGASRIIIENQNTKIWNFSLGLSNSGSEATGGASVNSSIGLDNLFLLNDSLTFSGSGNVPGTDSPENFSRSFTIKWSLPFGYWTLSYFRSQSRYLSLISPSGLQKVRYIGNSLSENYSIERSIYRARTAKTVFAISLNQNTSKNFLEDELLVHSSGSNSSSTVNLSHSQYTGWGSVRINGGYSFGIHSPESKGITFATDRTIDDLNWKKTELGLTYSLPFSLGQENFTVQSSFQQQNSNHILHPNEEFVIGGLYTVRGFRNQSLSADIGYYFRNELHWNLSPNPGEDPIAHLWGVPSLFIAYDLGQTGSNTRSPNVGVLHGVAVGTNSYGKYGNFSLVLSQSLSAPTYFEKERALWFSMGFNF